MTVGRRWWPLATASAGLLAWSAVVVPALPPAPAVRTLANVAATVALVSVARRAGLASRELGVDRATWRAGARWGGAALAVATTGYLVALATPAGRDALAGSAAAGMTTGEVVARAVVLIPVGTVLCEEIAFRGVLLALARRQLPARPAGAVTALVFGLWHLGPALRAGAEVAPLLRSASAAGTVLVTGLGGVAFAWLRFRSGSLLAPVGLHLGTNSLGLLAAAAAR